MPRPECQSGRGFFLMEPAAAVIQLNNPKTVRAWCMYDWANSVYSLVITSAIFPVYYKAVAVTADGSDDIPFLGFTIKNSVLYSYALSFSFLIVAAILPLLSGVSDYTGHKKQFMKMFVFIGSFSCMGLYFFNDIETLWWGLLCSILASIGYSGSLVFYDAFLPEIVSEDRYDEVSARGYSMGYYGSVILMIACLVMILNFSAFGFTTEGGATRFSFLLVGIWWILFSLMSFAVLPQHRYRIPKGNIWTKGYQEVLTVWRSLKNTPDLKRYLTAFFFYNMGVQTVMYLATLFGTDVLNLSSDKLIATILLIQLVAAFGAWLFARISRQKGNSFTLSFMISCWIVVCFVAYFINNEFQFYALATMVGMIMGGIQSLSRATYAKLIPENTIDHASYFSFYDVTYNLSIVFGTFSFGIINQVTGSMRNSALALALYFIIGLIVLNKVKSSDIAAPKSRA
ncbi:MFS transporter [Oscillatoria amoena NRMC-F 0135]|nr:MFS transporter [Oscillatoria amoena NRMC-F 0135]